MVPEEPRQDSSSVPGPGERASVASSARHTAGADSPQPCAPVDGSHEDASAARDVSTGGSTADRRLRTLGDPGACDAAGAATAPPRDPRHTRQSACEGAAPQSVPGGPHHARPTARQHSVRTPGDALAHLEVHGHWPDAAFPVGAAATELLEALGLRDQARVDAVARGLRCAWRPALRNGSTERQLVDRLLGARR